jgi:hypothetical protein
MVTAPAEACTQDVNAILAGLVGAGGISDVMTIKEIAGEIYSLCTLTMSLWRVYNGCTGTPFRVVLPRVTYGRSREAVENLEELRQKKHIQSQWLLWSYIPGLHWIAWIQAGFLARYAWYYWIGCAYALPMVVFLVSERPLFRLILLSWGLSLLHILTQRHEITRRINAIHAHESVRESLMQALLQAAVRHRGCLSVTEGVMETGRSFAEVEQVLNQMLESGYVFTRNNPETGVIEYVFKELL